LLLGLLLINACLVSGEWVCQLRFITLSWLLRRVEAFAHLSLDTELQDCHEMTTAEVSMIKTIAAGTTQGPGLRFWATAHIVQLLCCWGTSISIFLHSCPCHKLGTPAQKKCKMKGRQCVAMASGKWLEFIDSLKAIVVDAGAVKAWYYLERLRDSGDGEFADMLLSNLQACKATMVFRCMQAWGFWGMLPWRVLAMAQHLVNTTVAEQVSLTVGRMLYKQYQASQNKSRFGKVAWVFFDERGSLHQFVFAWLSGQSMHDSLLQHLLGYATALYVMQRLEAKHHYLHVDVSHSRAISPPALIAGLRRRANADLQDSRFRSQLPVLMSSFHELVPFQSASFQDLLEMVYGYGLPQLHADLSQAQACFKRFSALKDALACSLRQPAPEVMGCLTLFVFMFVVFEMCFAADELCLELVVLYAIICLAGSRPTRALERLLEGVCLLCRARGSVEQCLFIRPVHGFPAGDSQALLAILCAAGVLFGRGRIVPSVCLPNRS
jgi:hypothetical protein